MPRKKRYKKRRSESGLILEMLKHLSSKYEEGILYTHINEKLLNVNTETLNRLLDIIEPLDLIRIEKQVRSEKTERRSKGKPMREYARKRIYITKKGVDFYLYHKKGVIMFGYCPSGFNCHSLYQKTQK